MLFRKIFRRVNNFWFDCIELRSFVHMECDAVVHRPVDAFSENELAVVVGI